MDKFNTLSLAAAFLKAGSMSRILTTPLLAAVLALGLSHGALSAVVANSHSGLLAVGPYDNQDNAASSSVESGGSKAASSAGPDSSGQLWGKSYVRAETGSPSDISKAETQVFYGDTWNCSQWCEEEATGGLSFDLQQSGVFRWNGASTPLFSMRLIYQIGKDYEFDFNLKSDVANVTDAASASIKEYDSDHHLVHEMTVPVTIKLNWNQEYYFWYNATINTPAYQTFAENLSIESFVNTGVGGYYIDSGHSFYATPASEVFGYGSDSKRTIWSDYDPVSSVPEPSEAALMSLGLVGLWLMRRRFVLTRP